MRTRYAVRRDRCHQPGWEPLFKPQALTGAQLLSPSQASWPSLYTHHSFCLKQPSLPSVPDKFSHFGYNTSTSESFLLREASSSSGKSSPQECLLLRQVSSCSERSSPQEGLLLRRASSHYLMISVPVTLCS